MEKINNRVGRDGLKRANKSVEKVVKIRANIKSRDVFLGVIVFYW